MRAIRIGYVAGFAEGTGAHLLDIVTGGPHAYRGFPLPSQILFHLLLILDPLTAYATWRRRPSGPVLACGVMLADLAANWQGAWRSVLADPGSLLQPYGLSVLTLFGIFVFVTAAPLRASCLSALESSRPVPPPPDTMAAFAGDERPGD